MAIEFLHPGVYLTELPFEAHPIDGVTQDPPAPDWTDHAPHDPGITLLELLAYSAQSLSYRIDLSSTASRYIGETEKNIDAAFGDAEPGHAELRYEESESLFGDRP